MTKEEVQAMNTYLTLYILVYFYIILLLCEYNHTNKQWKNKFKRNVFFLKKFKPAASHTPLCSLVLMIRSSHSFVYLSPFEPICINHIIMFIIQELCMLSLYCLSSSTAICSTLDTTLLLDTTAHQTLLTGFKDV